LARRPRAAAGEGMSDPGVSKGNGKGKRKGMLGEQPGDSGKDDDGNGGKEEEIPLDLPEFLLEALELRGEALVKAEREMMEQLAHLKVDEAMLRSLIKKCAARE